MSTHCEWANRFDIEDYDHLFEIWKEAIKFSRMGENVCTEYYCGMKLFIQF